MGLAALPFGVETRPGHDDDVPTVVGDASRPASAPTSRQPVLVPLSEGRYTVLGLLGRGGQSIVHRAHDAAIGRDVAIKEVLPSSEGSDGASEAHEAIARFLREARITGQLEHPGVVPVHEVGVKPDGSPYCVQKLVRGRTLAAAIADCEEPAACLALLPHLLAACHAVAFAHGRGVIHRDLKPANIMVGEFGETVVLDWGLARVLGEAEERDDASARLSPDVRDAGLTVTGSVLGTPGYASPEQLAGEHDRVDRRSDVWSLGMILQQIIAGGEPSARRAAPPPELVAIMRRALSTDPDLRYASAAEMASDLEAYREGRIVSAHEYGAWEVLRRLVRRHRAVASALGVGLVALVVALVLISRAWTESRANLAEAFLQQADRAVADRDWPVAEASHAMAASLRDSPASRWGVAIAEAGDPVAGAAWHVHEQVRELAVSPDGAWVITSADAEAAIWTIQSGEWISSFDGHDAFITAATIDSGGIAWTADEAGLVLGWDPATGREVARHVTGLEGIRGASVAGPGLLLLPIRARGLVSLDTRSGTVEEIAGAPAAIKWEEPAPDGDRIVTIGDDGTFALRTAGSSPTVRRPHDHAHYIETVVISKDGSLFATCGADRTVMLRTWPDGAERARLTGHAGSIGRAAFSPDGSLLATPSTDGVMLWSTRRGTLHARFSAGRGVHRVAFTPDGQTLVTAGHRGEVRTWHLPDWARHVDPEVRQSALGFAPGGELLLSGGADGDLRVIRIADGSVVAQAHVHEAGYGVNAMSIHPSGALVATAGNDGIMATWTLPSLELLARIAPGEKEAFAVTWSPDGETLWSGWGTGVVLRHDRSLRSPLSRFQAHERHGVLTTEVSGDGRVLLTSSRDRTARLWDTSTLMLRRELKTVGAAMSASLSPDGRTVATATDEGRVTTWDWETGRKVAEHAHDHWALDLAYRPDGSVLASSGFDALRLWDMRSGEQVATSKVSDLGASRVAWSGDGKWLATSTISGPIHWQPVGDSSIPVHLDAVLERRRLRRDGVTFRDEKP